MGVAAYNRGSAIISAAIDAERRAVEFECMDALNSMQKFADCGQPFGDVVFAHGNGGWWVESPADGFGFWYPDLHEAVKRWNVAVVGYANGNWLATPLAARA